jgi:hypothetical protein
MSDCAGPSYHSGGRVLEGQIKRGMGETIRAAIWLCDLRGFTSLSESLPRDELVEMLNQYFGPMCDAVDANLQSLPGSFITSRRPLRCKTRSKKTLTAGNKRPRARSCA